MCFANETGISESNVVRDLRQTWTEVMIKSPLCIKKGSDLKKQNLTKLCVHTQDVGAQQQFIYAASD